ncbi:MAG TPA: urease accessory protein UreE [Arenibaculum sp.]|nr:urease accessory protein UreE [Arenibaculum sp.]
MPRATRILPAGEWSGTPADRVTLDHDERHRRRIAMRGDGGLAFLLDLPEARVLHHGDALTLDDGRLVEVHAKAEPLLEVRGRDGHHLLRLAWHLGNRHLAAAIQADHILIRPDHVIAEMLRGLGAEVTSVTAPFDPEGGAYGDGARHAGGHHHHHHDHD